MERKTEVTIYLDAVWALNFFLDFMLLMLTQALARDNTGKLRIGMGAFIASAIVPLSLYYPQSFFTTMLGKVIYSLCIVISSFRWRSLNYFIKLLALFYFTTFSIGGGLMAVHFFFHNQLIISKSGILTMSSGYGDPISWVFIVILFPLVWLFTKKRMDEHAVEKIRYEQHFKVTLELKNISYSTTGFIDSGNQLVDPISKKPVVICDESFLKQWFSDKEWELMKASYEQLDFDNIPKSWEKLVHIIPFQGVEGGSRFLLAIRPEQLIIDYDQEKIITKKVLIGIQFGHLTKDRSYHCLLQPQLIKLAKLEPA